MDFVFDLGLVLYLPLCELDGSSFMSKDAYGHSCTATGALWRPQGRLFDGVDDAISCGSDTSIDNIWAGGGTVIAWINPASDGENNVGQIANKEKWLFYVSAEAASKVKLTFVHKVISGNDGIWVTTNTVVDINTWSMCTVTFDKDSILNNPTIYINAESVAVVETTAPQNSFITEASETLLLGNNSAGAWTFDGYIGETFGYGRALTPQEIQHHYLSTKWRYQ